MSVEHEKWMKVALSLARRGLGNVAPNPAVGCLLVKDDIVVGRGWTQPGGRPHAETCALDMAGDAAKGATAYVTLEPCAHHGKTPPCAEALVKTGIKTAVVAALDPDNRVAGRGIALLKQAGILTITGILEAEGETLNAGFFTAKSKSRPCFTLKVAASLDGRIATSSGQSKWITSTEARKYGHKMRSQHDAILVGVNTVIADDPSLDCRIEGLEQNSPRPIILDSELRTPIKCKLLENASNRPPLIICRESAAASGTAEKLKARGAELIAVSDTRNLKEVGKILSDQGLTRVLVEGGSQILAAFFKAGYGDRLVSFTAGKIIGADGLGSVGTLSLAELGDAPHLTLEGVRKIGPDLLATYVNAE